MSPAAEALLDKLKKLPREELEEVAKELSRSLATNQSQTKEKFPTVRLPGGTITSEQVADVLDDED